MIGLWGVTTFTTLFFELTNNFSIWNSGGEHGHILGLNPQPSALLASTKCQYHFYLIFQDIDVQTNGQMEGCMAG